jgi:hypothetical protein
LENAEYNGHSLTMLQRIAPAQDRRLKRRHVPTGKGGAMPREVRS